MEKRGFPLPVRQARQSPQRPAGRTVQTRNPMKKTPRRPIQIIKTPSGIRCKQTVRSRPFELFCRKDPHAQSLVEDHLVFGICKISTGDHDEIHQGPDAAGAQRQKLKNARAGLSDIETVDTQSTQKKAEEKSSRPILFAFPQIQPFGRVYRATALYTYDRIFADLGTAMATKHKPIFPVVRTSTVYLE